MNDRDLREIIARGEGQTTEFKQSFAESQEAIESLCAFSHAQGGLVIFGVRDDGTIVGVQVGKQTIEGFANRCYRSAVPPLTPEILEFVIAEKRLAVATINKCPEHVVGYVSGVAYVRVGKTNQVMPPGEQRRRYHVGFVAANSTQQPAVAASPANVSWHEREAHRAEMYRQHRGLFLGHSWEPSSVPGQVADIVIFLRQHDSGEDCDRPLAEGHVKSVEYHLGAKFFDNTVVVGHDVPDFRLSISAYGPVLCLAQVNFDDGSPPIMLDRYIDF